MTNSTDNTQPVALQAGVNAMQVLYWQNNQWRSGPLLTQAQVGLAQAPTGVQVALTVRGQKVPLTKAFLLGGSI
jgi:general secretion pathway protein J